MLVPAPRAAAECAHVGAKSCRRVLACLYQQLSLSVRIAAQENAVVGRGRLCDKKILLVKPMT